MEKKHITFRIDSDVIDKIGREENKSKLVNDLLKQHVYKTKEKDKTDLSFLKEWEKKLDEGKEGFDTLSEEIKDLKNQNTNFINSLNKFIKDNLKNVSGTEKGLTDEDKQFIQNLFQDNRKYIKLITDDNRQLQKDLSLKTWFVIGGAIVLYILIKFL
jgi:hypothetical protein